MLIQPNQDSPRAPGSLALFVSPVSKGGLPIDEADADPLSPRSNSPSARGEVVREKPDSPAVQPVSKVDPATRTTIRGQELRSTRALADPVVELTKVFRIWEGQDGFEVDLRFAGPQQNAKLTYRLVGPHGSRSKGNGSPPTSATFSLAR